MPMNYAEWMRKSPEERRGEMAKRVGRCTDGKERVAVALVAHGAETPVVQQFRYLMQEDDKVSTLMLHIRKQLVAMDKVEFHEQSALFLFAKEGGKKGGTLLKGTTTMSELREAYVGEDGFVHVLYATENVFG